MGLITVEGDEAVVAALDRAGLTVGTRASRVVVDTAEAIRQTQIDTVRHRSGQTAGSVAATNADDAPLSVGDLVAEIGPEFPDGWRARFLEHGTQRHGPFPFVAASMEAHRAGFVTGLARVAGDV